MDVAIVAVIKFFHVEMLNSCVGLFLVLGFNFLIAVWKVVVLWRSLGMP